MDTDSFILSIKTTNVLKHMDYFKIDFDFSELDTSHELYDTINKKVIGKMKIETSPIIAHILAVQKIDKLALNPFDDKRVYLNPIQSLSWDKHVQSGDCPCIYCLK